MGWYINPHQELPVLANESCQQPLALHEAGHAPYKKSVDAM